ncbi:Polyphenol oxidase [Macleaya cordata]|uniref:Polyphenol oxidase n=1 Tax=Macleaya cordata TaxID=56857 RepID=A0A200PQP1_MACCD|nr:Polyphenol oxidase [Macleaya cordata]
MEQVKDCLDQENLRYKYQEVDIPWLKARPMSRKARAAEKQAAKKKSASTTGFPKILDKEIQVVVKRPKKSRSRKDKEDEEEILEINGIELERDTYVKFDVYINAEDEIGPDKSEFAGSFVNVPHKHGKTKKKLNTCLRLGISDLLEDLDADDDDDVLVTLVPKQGKGVVSIEGIKIVFAS